MASQLGLKAAGGTGLLLCPVSGVQRLGVRAASSVVGARALEYGAANPAGCSRIQLHMGARKHVVVQAAAPVTSAPPEVSAMRVRPRLRVHRRPRCRHIVHFEVL